MDILEFRLRFGEYLVLGTKGHDLGETVEPENIEVNESTNQNNERNTSQTTKKWRIQCKAGYRGAKVIHESSALNVMFSCV